MSLNNVTHLTWIANPIHNDYFKSLFDMPDFLIETPLVTIDDVFINNYIRIPLINGIYKYDIDVVIPKGNHHFIDAFHSFVSSIDLEPLKITTTKKINENELLGLISILKIILNLHFNYIIEHIEYYFLENTTIFMPMIKNKTVDYIYGTNKHINNIQSFIDIDIFIGYKSLLSLYYKEIPTETYVSDLINLLPLKQYHCKIISDIPVVAVDGQMVNEAFATMTEFNIDSLSGIVKELMSLNNQVFKVCSNEINLDYTYDMKIKEKKDDCLYLFKDEYRDKDWLLDVSQTKLPIYRIIGDWVFNHKSNIDTIVYLTYVVKKNIKDLKNVHIASDLSITLPIALNQINYFKNKITIDMDKPKLIVKATDKNDALLKKKTLNANDILLLNNHWYVIIEKVNKYMIN